MKESGIKQTLSPPVLRDLNSSVQHQPTAASALAKGLNRNQSIQYIDITEDDPVNPEPILSRNISKATLQPQLNKNLSQLSLETIRNLNKNTSQISIQTI